MTDAAGTMGIDEARYLVRATPPELYANKAILLNTALETLRAEFFGVVLSEDYTARSAQLASMFGDFGLVLKAMSLETAYHDQAEYMARVMYQRLRIYNPPVADELSAPSNRFWEGVIKQIYMPLMPYSRVAKKNIMLVWFLKELLFLFPKNDLMQAFHYLAGLAESELNAADHVYVKDAATKALTDLLNTDMSDDDWRTIARVLVSAYMRNQSHGNTHFAAWLKQIRAVSADSVNGLVDGMLAEARSKNATATVNLLSALMKYLEEAES